MPDITLLPSLARTFNITIDQLFSFENNLSQVKRKSLIDESYKRISKLGYEKTLSKLKKYVASYPNDMDLLLEIINFISLQAPIYLEGEGLDLEYQSLIKMTGKIIRSSQTRLHQPALFIKASSLFKLKSYEESEKIIEDLWMTYNDPTILQLQVYEEQEKWDELESLSKSMLLSYLNNSIAMLSFLSRKMKVQEDMEKSMDYLKASSIIEEVFQIGLGTSNYKLALSYYDLKDYERASGYLLKFITSAVNQTGNYNKNKYFSGLNLKISSEEVQVEFRKNMLKEILLEFDKEELKDYEDYNRAISLINAYMDKKC